MIRIHARRKNPFNFRLIRFSTAKDFDKIIKFVYEFYKQRWWNSTAFGWM